VWLGVTVKGSPQDYARIAREMQVSQFILVPGAVTWETYRDIFSETTKGDGLNILVAPRFSGLFSGSLRVSYVGYVPMLRFRPGYTGGLNKAAKTILDLTLGLGIFIFCLPAMLIFSIWIYWSKGWPAWEAHKVLGLYGRPFYTYKFRTGLHGENHRYFDQAPLPETAPAGPGKFSLECLLLTSGLDKLLQLINVLRGQMSIVGPRTIYEREAGKLGVWLPSIMGVKPGMTGPWAVGEVPDLQQEISLTLSYIHTWTPWKDLHILCLTLFYLFQRRLIVRPTGPPEN
jgi:exopolysaccharide production protein ExoY